MTPLDADTARLLEVVHSAATEKLAREPVALDLRGLTTMTDVLYACHADSGRAPDRIPVDFGSTGTSGLHVSCVVGLREYYGLEKLWADAEPLELTEPVR